MPKQSYEDMVRTIQNGESVIIGSKVCSTLEQLPSRVDIAQQDPDQAKAMFAQMFARMQQDQIILTALAGAAGMSTAGVTAQTPDLSKPSDEDGKTNTDGTGEGEGDKDKEPPAQ